MAKDKNSFVLYCDLIHTVRKLRKEDAGDLFLHILEYVNDNNPTTNNPIVDIAFEPIKQSLKRDLKKYEERAERSRENGKKVSSFCSSEFYSRSTSFFKMWFSLLVVFSLLSRSCIFSACDLVVLLASLTSLVNLNIFSLHSMMVFS